MWDKEEKYCVAGQAIDNNTHNTAHALACWVTNATDTHSACAILVAFLRQQWLYDCDLMLCLYILFLSCFSVVIQPEFEAGHSPTSSEEAIQEYTLLLAVRT